MKARLHVIGLGPAGLEQMAVGVYRMLHKADKIFMRTLQHPCAQELLNEGLKIESFDEIYASADSFEQVYEKIILRLREELVLKTEVFYAVPGHPMVAEKTVALILDKLAADAEIVIHPALSFLDEIFRAIPFDPIEGLLVRNYDELTDGEITGREWLVIPQVYSKLIASEVKLDLMKSYADEAEVFVLRALGSGGQTVAKTKLYELDHYEFDHLSTVVLPPQEEVISLTRLKEVMAKLRSTGGCPWDREQTHESLKQYLIEESYEVLDAIDNKDMYNLCEELGDLLLQVVFHAQIAVENGDFELQDVLEGIISKLIRRHPHVFADGEAKTASEVIQTWEQIKKEEKGQEKEELKGLLDLGKPKGLPALMQAVKLQKKAAKFGFDWPDLKGPLAKVEEELQELKEALDLGTGIKEEFGDLLFALVNLSRFLQLDAEDTLRQTIGKFQRRFDIMAQLAADEGLKIESLALDRMDIYWERAKTQEKSGNIIEV